LKEEEIIINLHDRTLSVINKGAPLRMEFEKMTERFRKDNADPNSTGLGLAIVKRICDTYAYRLGYAYYANAHTFSITF
jgi:signal transduction histidine kinase